MALQHNDQAPLRFSTSELAAIATERNDVRMAAIGTRTDETGKLLRDGGAFYLRRDLGGRYELDVTAGVTPRFFQRDQRRA
jgi:hypothetical protein